MSVNVTTYQHVYCDRQVLVRPWSCSLLAFIFLLLVLAVKVWLHIYSTSIGYEIARSKAYYNNLDMQRRDLELQKSVLYRPDYVALKAQKLLQMSAVAPSRIRKIK